MSKVRVVGTVVSESVPNLKYAVTVGRTGWACQCEAFRYGDGKKCKHIRAVIRKAKSLAKGKP